MSGLAPQLLAQHLDNAAVARLAVIDDDGGPDVMPIVFARVASQLFSPIDGKPKRHGRLARLRHIEARPRVGLVIDHYDHDWRSLWWIRITAIAHIAVGHHPSWDAAVAALLTKYPQYQATPLFSGEPTLICFEPVSVRSWAAADGANTPGSDRAPP